MRSLIHIVLVAVALHQGISKAFPIPLKYPESQEHVIETHQDFARDELAPKSSIFVPVPDLNALGASTPSSLSIERRSTPPTATETPSLIPSASSTLDDTRPGAIPVTQKPTTSTNCPVRRSGTNPPASELDCDDILAFFSDLGVRPTSLQTNAPWNLAALTSESTLEVPGDRGGSTFNGVNGLDWLYPFDPAAGWNVRTYVIGSGVNPHKEFGSRLQAMNGQQLSSAEDTQGLGTMVASVLAGTVFGVAKKATIVPVKIPTTSDGHAVDTEIIAGLNSAVEDLQWSNANAKPPPVGGVIIISVQREENTVNMELMTAIDNITVKGIHVVVSTESNSENECNGGWGILQGQTDFRRPPILVGAISFDNELPNGANWAGPECVTMYAPGEDIFVASPFSPTAIVQSSGTALAAAHVAGLIATIISSTGNIEPGTQKEQMTTYLRHLDTAKVHMGLSEELPGPRIFLAKSPIQSIPVSPFESYALDLSTTGYDIPKPGPLPASIINTDRLGMTAP